MIRPNQCPKLRWLRVYQRLQPSGSFDPGRADISGLLFPAFQDAWVGSDSPAQVGFAFAFEDVSSKFSTVASMGYFREDSWGFKKRFQGGF